MTSLAAWLGKFEISLSSDKRFVPRIFHRLAGPALRKIVIASGDPVIRRQIQGVDMLLPYSHQLPNYASQYPFYETAFPAFAKFLADELRRKILVVDVGANVGDTAKMLAAAVGVDRLTCICIEADGAYIPLLEENTRGMAVTIVNAAAGAHAGERNLSVVPTGKGSSVILAQDDKLTLICLDDLLEDKTPDIIKTDTDGFEIEVLSGAKKTLAKTSAHMFVEFSPGHLRGIGKANPADLFSLLGEAGYTTCLAYDNEGYPIAVTELGDRATGFLMNYCEVKPYCYMDILISKDDALLNRFYERDLRRYEDQKHWRRYRNL